MSNGEQESNLPLGLDVGTSRIVVARTPIKVTAQYESQLNAFLTLPYSKLAESLLEREDVFHEVRGRNRGGRQRCGEIRRGLPRGDAAADAATAS